MPGNYLTAAMQQDFGFRVHMSAVRGQIAADPVDAQNRLNAGEFDDFFDDATLSRLSRDAGSAVRVRASAAAKAERARQRALALDTTAHLEMVAETGAGDAGLDARARSALPPEDYAAFQASEAEARERHATRVEYAFMTEAEIETDIAAQAPGPGPRDMDEREAGRAIRLATRDEILAARAADPAGWAMRDEVRGRGLRGGAGESGRPGTGYHNRFLNICWPIVAHDKASPCWGGLTAGRNS